METLDQQAVMLAKAIRQSESGGNFQAQGKSGEYGAYQFTEPTWQATSQKYLGQAIPLQQATPEQQNEVAYKQIKEWKDKGYNVGQVASMWNAGEKNPDLYKDDSAVGINKYGAKFNVPAYAKSVATAYQTLKSGGQPGVDTSNPSSVAQPQQSAQTAQPESLGGKAWDVAKGVANWAFPIVGDIASDIKGTNKKTLLQQAADLGLSGLWFIPGLGEVGEGARGTEAAVEGGGLLAKALGSTALKGAAVGYGAGTLSNLSQGQGIGQSLAPNVSNVLGAATGGIAGAVLPKISNILKNQFTEEGALSKTSQNIEQEVRRLVPGSKLMNNLPEGGSRASKLIVASGNLPTVEGNKFIVVPAIDSMYERIARLGETRAEALDKIGTTASLDDIIETAKSHVGNVPEGQTAGEQALIKQRKFSGEVGSMNSKLDKIAQDIKSAHGLVPNPDGTWPDMKLSASDLEALKEVQTSNSGRFKYNGSLGDQNASSVLGSVAKNELENMADKSGFSGIKEYNSYIKDHYDAIKVLQQLGNRTVKGGRLGNMLMGHTMGLAASAAESAVGGGFLGSVGGLIAGEGAGNFLSKLMGETTLSNPLRDALLNKITQEDPQIVQELMQYAGKTGKIAPMAVAASKKMAGRTKGLLPGLLTKGAIKASSGVGKLMQ